MGSSGSYVSICGSVSLEVWIFCPCPYPFPWGMSHVPGRGEGKLCMNKGCRGSWTVEGLIYSPVYRYSYPSTVKGDKLYWCQKEAKSMSSWRTVCRRVLWLFLSLDQKQSFLGLGRVCWKREIRGSRIERSTWWSVRVACKIIIWMVSRRQACQGLWSFILAKS